MGFTSVPDAPMSHPTTLEPLNSAGLETPNLVFFSSVSENTRRFVDRLEYPAARIPVRLRVEAMLRVTQPFVLVVPTYGGGDNDGAVPKQVVQFLNIAENRQLLRGVIAAGNTNFGEHYCLAGPVIANKCRIPELYRFELLGTDKDVDTVRNGLPRFWAQPPIAGVALTDRNLTN